MMYVAILALTFDPVFENGDYNCQDSKLIPIISLIVQVLARLEQFQKKNAPAPKPVEPLDKTEGRHDEDLSDWRKVRLKFSAESGKVRQYFLSIFVADFRYYFPCN